MNVPNSFGRTYVDTKSKLRAVLFGLLSLFVFSIVSINEAVAQSPSQLGEELTAQMLDRFQEEHRFLEGEIKNPAAGVDISLNGALVKAYSKAQRSFQRGNSLVQVLSTVIADLELSNGNNSSPSWGQRNRNDQLEVDAGNMVEELESFGGISTLDELDQAFLLIRNLKNQ